MSVPLEPGREGRILRAISILCARGGGVVSQLERFNAMIELIQIPYSPYCIVQRRILEYAGAKFKLVNVPNGDRSTVWRVTKQQYYQVPVLKDGKQVLFESADNSQVIAAHLDAKFGLNLFPREWAGVQDLLWTYFEDTVEGIGFKLNDIYYLENVPAGDRLAFVRHKERKFGRGCLDRWRTDQAALLAAFEASLAPAEAMLATRPFLLGSRPLFVDFDLYGMVANMLYSGHYEFPARCPLLAAWHSRMAKVRGKDFAA